MIHVALLKTPISPSRRAYRCACGPDALVGAIIPKVVGVANPFHAGSDFGCVRVENHQSGGVPAADEQPMVGGIQRHWVESLEPGQRPFVENHSAKRLLPAATFVLWAMDQLLPSGRLATFIGDVVIAAYILDLYWLI